jgi:lysophospholipid acyltransferase (LPLAT)-like uncharacterized protein
MIDLTRPLVSAAGHLFANWLRTLRVRMALPDGSSVAPSQYDFRSLIFAITERDLLASLAVARGRSFRALVAEGRDGDWAVEFAAPLGCTFIRGSSLHHGARALRALVRALNTDTAPAVMVVDGPVGPPNEVKEGVVACAALTRRAIVPAAMAARGKIVFRGSWAAHYLPLPFARVVIAVGEPMCVGRGPSRAEVAENARAVGAELRRLREVALGEVRK